MLTPRSSTVALQSAIVSYAQSDTCAASKARNKRSSCDVGTLGADIIGQTGTGGLFIDLIQFPTGAQLPALIPAVAVGLSQVVTARTGNRSTSRQQLAPSSRRREVFMDSLRAAKQPFVTNAASSDSGERHLNFSTTHGVDP